MWGRWLGELLLLKDGVENGSITETNGRPIFSGGIVTAGPDEIRIDIFKWISS